MIGWLADGFRALWAFPYWNIRKSLFRLRGARGFPPCQNRSDSGRAYETRCDACYGWRRHARFRLVCPLLKTAPDGTWKCSANAPDVRPFWARCLAVFGGGALALYLVVTLTVFGAMRLIGYPVRLPDVIWPGSWDRINVARSSYFLKQSEDAYRDGRLNESLMALSLAFQYNPANTAAGLTLARLWQTHRPDLSNRLYAQLLSQNPEQRVAIAEQWLRALAPRGDAEAIEELAANALRFDPDHTAAWLQALVFANRRTGNQELLDHLVTTSEPIPAGARHLIQLEATIRPLAAESARLLLIDLPEPGLPHYLVTYQARNLVRLGFPADALDLIARDPGRIDRRDRIAIELSAYASLGYRRLLEAAFDRAMSERLSSGTIDLVAAHLIAFPDAEFYDRLMRAARAARIGDGSAAPSALLTLFVLAGLQGDFDRLVQFRDLLRARSGADFRALDLAERHFRGDEPMRPQHLLPLLQPLALEVNYALHDRLAPKVTAAAK